MIQPTGSVYLDTPRAVSRRPVSEPAGPRGPRVLAAAVLAIVGIVALTAASVFAAVRVLVNDTDAFVDAADAALDDDQVWAELEAEISAAIQDTLFDAELTAQAARFGIDVETEVATLAPTILDDPVFRAALRDLVAQTHERVVLAPNDEPVNLTPLTSAAIAVIEREVPEAAAILPDDNVLFIVTPDQIPDFTGPVELLDRGIAALALAGLALPLAAVVHPRRHHVIAWSGRWLLMMGLIAAALAVGLPYVGNAITGQAIVEVSIRTVSSRLLAPAAVASVAGVSLTALAAILRRRADARAADARAAFALAFDEPPLPGVLAAPSPQMQLAQRGLVDASQPLTNI